jgi:hypothetical protein
MPHLIQLQTQNQDPQLTELAPILAALFPVKFVEFSEGSDGVMGRIITGDGLVSNASGTNAPVPTFKVPGGEGLNKSDGLISLTVRFADDPDVPFPFRGRTVQTQVGAEPKFLTLVEGEKALAHNERGCLWSLANLKGVTMHRSALALPRIPDNGNLHDILNGGRFLEMLPLLDFLRKVCGYQLFHRPVIRAEFMFDDPNLHWPTYGLVDYREIARRAEKENYHVSFATVPLDAWYTHGRAAEIFRANPARLSLCVHGNDHTKRELALNYNPADRVFLLQQAARRIGRLERRANLRVARVMVPPHGACSHEMLAEISGSEFEAACISHGSLRAHNRSRPWTRNLGYLPSELIAGCPVLPRWGFAGATEATMLLAAFLDQPIILRGHHQDLKDGIELLDGFARVINGLGQVEWADMTGISRKSYFSRMRADVMELRPLTRKIEIRVPEKTTELLIEHPASQNWTAWNISGPGGIRLEARAGERIPLPAMAGKTIMVDTQSSLTATIPPVSRVSVTAFLRRLLTEGRDRFQGLFRRN